MRAVVVVLSVGLMTLVGLCSLSVLVNGCSVHVTQSEPRLSDDQIRFIHWDGMNAAERVDLLDRLLKRKGIDLRHRSRCWLELDHASASGRGTHLTVEQFLQALAVQIRVESASGPEKAD